MGKMAYKGILWHLNYILFYLRSILIKTCKGDWLYMIKPRSPMLVFIARFLLLRKICLDINDPLHVSGHIGKFSYARTFLMMCFCNKIVFESVEYRDFWGSFIRSKSKVIEDTPQFSEISSSYTSRKKNLVWFGSPETSETLLPFMQYFVAFRKYGYDLVLLGASSNFCNHLSEMGIDYDIHHKYDSKLLKKVVSNAAISFVPMLDNEKYTLRGNLKAKYSMACGAVTIASKVPMHTRLITHGFDGFIFDTYDEFVLILDSIGSDRSLPQEISKNANIKIFREYTPQIHAAKICKFINS